MTLACGRGSPPGRNLGKKILASRGAGLTQSQKDGIFDHCSYDVQRFCPSITRSDANYFREAAGCLQDYADDITGDCSNAFEDICGDSGDDCDFDQAVEGPGNGPGDCLPSQNL